jgi:hypothetical protein
MTMTERQWELYRFSVVEKWQESPHKAAVIGGDQTQPDDPGPARKSIHRCMVRRRIASEK